MNLIPQKRMDKTGKLVTRHVLADGSAEPAAKALPAPTVGSPAPSNKVSAGKFKPRPRQLEQKRYEHDISQFILSPPLQPDDNRYRQLRLRFYANELDVYSVLAVAYDTDAMKMMHDGVRSTEGAIAYLQERGMEPVFDRTRITQEALQRNIPVDLYRKFMVSNIPSSKMDSPYLVDAMELYGSASISDQYYSAFHGILDGEINAADIKKLGLTKLKSYDRLKDSIDALKQVNAPDAKFTIDDVKEVLDHCNRTATHNTKAQYFTALQYLINLGPEFVNSVSYNAIVEADNRYKFDKDRYELTRFHIAFNEKHGYVKIPLGGMGTIYRSGVDSDRVADLMKTGMKMEAAIESVREDIAPSVGTGWL